MKTALLIIDMQQALCVGEYAAYDIGQIIVRVNAVMAQARATGVPVVLIQHEEGDGPLKHGSADWRFEGESA
jgi:nicotinamidase-related amidase